MTTFSKQQLVQVRNEIDINELITHKLHLERQFNGIWRFQCPLCGQFNTATQKKTNLSRCFSCEQNFNTIDLVIYTKKLNFVPAVQWLLELLEKQTEKHFGVQKPQKEMTVYPEKKRVTASRLKGQVELKKIKKLLY